jgi:hypothetical protein
MDLDLGTRATLLTGAKTVKKRRRDYDEDEESGDP